MTIDVEKLVGWLGPRGARAGLESSILSLQELKEIASKLGIPASGAERRQEVIREIVSKFYRSIDKPLPDLLAMGYDDLMKYFEDRQPSRSELILVLRELGFEPGSEAKKSLYKYASRQISETGMFQRVARGPG